MTLGAWGCGNCTFTSDSTHILHIHLILAEHHGIYDVEYAVNRRTRDEEAA